MTQIIGAAPGAMTHYETCRVAACRRSGRARQRALSTCAADTIGRFIPADLTPALLPTRIHFDPQRQAIRPDGAETLDLVAIFLKAHPTEKVNLVGHSAPVDSQASSVRFGRARAERVKARLLAKGSTRRRSPRSPRAATWTGSRPAARTSGRTAGSR